MNRLEITLGALALSAVVSCIPVPQGIPPLDYKESISDQQSQQCIDESTGSERVRLDGQANSLGPYCVSFMYGFISRLEKCFEAINPELSYGCFFVRKSDDLVIIPAQAAQVCVSSNQNKTEIGELENLTVACYSTSRDHVFFPSD